MRASATTTVVAIAAGVAAGGAQAAQVGVAGIANQDVKRLAALGVRARVLERDLQRGLGNRFVQVAIDVRRGQVVVTVRRGTSQARIMRAVARSGYLGRALRIRRIAAGAGAGSRVLPQRIAATLMRPAVAGAEQVVTGVGRGDGTIKLGIAPGTSAAERAAAIAAAQAQSQGLPVEAVTLPVATPTSSSDVAAGDVRCAPGPGSFWDIPVTCNAVLAGMSDQLGCQLAFRVRAKTGRDVGFLTAGHCKQDTRRWRVCAASNLCAEGDVLGNTFPTVDAAFLRMDVPAPGPYVDPYQDPYQDPYSDPYTDPFQDPRTKPTSRGMLVAAPKLGVRDIRGAADPVFGSIVCGTGYGQQGLPNSQLRTFNTQCGLTTFTNVSLSLKLSPTRTLTVRGFNIVLGYCARPGDSGSPVTYPERSLAAGIVSASLCGAPLNLPLTAITSIGAATQALGVELR